MPVLGGGSVNNETYADRGMWDPGSVYVRGDVVTYGLGGRFIAKTSHTAGAVFDTTKFVRLDATAAQVGEISEGSVLDNFIDISAWTATPTYAGVTLSAGTGDVTVGTYLHAIASTTASFRMYRPLFMNMRDKFISFRVRITAGQGSAGLYFVGGAAGTTATHILQIGANNAAAQTGTTDAGVGTGWRTVTVSGAQLSGTGTALTDVRQIGFYMSVAETATTIVADFADLRVHDNPLPPGVVWLFDDARLSQHTNAFPIMTTAGLVGNAYIASNILGGTLVDTSITYPVMTLAQVQELKAAGWVVGSHTHTHANITAITSAQRRTEFDDTYAYLITNNLVSGGGTGAHLAYPFGAYDAASLPDVAAYFRSGRTIMAGESWSPTIGDRFRLPCRNVFSDATATSAMTAMTAAADLGGIVPVLFHEILTTANASGYPLIAKFQEIVNHAQSLGLACYTLDELFPQFTPGPILS